MIEFRKCYPEHVLLVQAQVAQQVDAGVILGGGYAQVVEGGPSFSGWVDHRCVGVAGLLPVWPGRAFAWAILSKQCGPHMLAITRKVQAVLAASPYRRVETTTLCGFVPAKRWIGRLGFSMESPKMRCYDNAGRDHMLWARIKG